MRKTFITGGSYAKLREIGQAGRPIYAFDRQLRTVVQTELGQKYAEFLAEPLVDEGTRYVDWYTTQEGNVSAASSLTDRERDGLMGEAEERLRKLRDLGTRYFGDPRDERRAIGEFLRQLQRKPAVEFLYRVGNQPVLTYWGHLPESPVAAEPQAAAPHPSSGTTVSGRTAVASRQAPPDHLLLWAGRLLWGSVGAAVAILVPVLILFQLGLWPLQRLLTSTSQAAEQESQWALADGQQEEEVLRAKLQELQMELSRRRAACIVPPPTQAPSPVSPPIPGGR